jgi:hypothetical protein
MGNNRSSSVPVAEVVASPLESTKGESTRNLLSETDGGCSTLQIVAVVFLFILLFSVLLSCIYCYQYDGFESVKNFVNYGYKVPKVGEQANLKAMTLPLIVSSKENTCEKETQNNAPFRSGSDTLDSLYSYKALNNIETNDNISLKDEMNNLSGSSMYLD